MVAGTTKIPTQYPPPKKKFFADLDELGPWKKI